MLRHKAGSRVALLALIIIAASLCGGAFIAQPAHAQDARQQFAELPRSVPSWLWPVEGRRTVVSPFRAPAHDYAAGHRGMDIVAATEDDSEEGTPVRAPAAGRIAFRGVVVDRPLITIEHEDGLVTTLEPVLSDLNHGDAVKAGEQVGTTSVGGHSVRGTIHVGVRLNGVYVNPMIFFGGVPRAVLLPCGDSGC